MDATTEVALGTRSHPEYRGAGSSVSGRRQSTRSAQDTVHRELFAGLGVRREPVGACGEDGPMTFTRRRATAATMWLTLALLTLLAPGAASSARAGQEVAPAQEMPLPDEPWSWPVEGQREVTEPYLAPAHDYGPGHRGMDLAAPTGVVVHAPADGVVAFRGVVVDRPLLTIDHGGGFVSTFEPLDSALNPGDVVRVGDDVGSVALGGHTEPGAVHLGVRWNGTYINPMLLFGDVPRAVLLPCCGPL